MVSDQDVCKTSLESSTDSRNIGRASSCNKNCFGALCSDFLFQARNRKTWEVIWRRVHHFINAASFCIKSPVVDVYSRMECLNRIDLFPAEDFSLKHFVICVWGPESHHEHIRFLTELDCIPHDRVTSVVVH